MYYKQENDNLKLISDKKDAQKILSDDPYFDLIDIEPETMLDKTLFGFFESCYKINKIISKHGFFLKFFERRNMYRFLIKKRSKEKMK